jgi:ubiquinone/menaquinone biosynthesis C-methylase UbiE
LCYEEASNAFMKIDFGKTAADYGRHRAGFPDEFFERLFAAGFLKPTCSVLDIGTGTGTVARGLAQRGCNATGLDPSAPLLAEARRIDAEAGITSIQYVEGRAEALPFADSTFDVVTAGQSWHWFGRTQAAAEAYRVLKKGGRIVIAHFDWVPLAGNVVDATERLIMRHNPQWQMEGGTGIHPAWLADVAIAGFSGIETFSFDVGIPYTHEGWRGRIRASAGVAAALPAVRVAQFDADLADLLANEFPEDPLIVPHRVWALVATR